MVSVRRVLPAVLASPSAMRSRMRLSKRDMSPTTRSRMPLVWSFATSCSSARAKSSIRSVTSSAGRRQFSLEKANSVRYSMPCSIAARTVARTASTPLRCPATRGSRRSFAQRPLPSMMIATWRGTRIGSGAARVVLVNTGRCAEAATSDRHQVGFLLLQQPVDVGDVMVGQLLQLLVRTPLVVLRALLVLQQALQVLVGVAAHVAHRDARGLGFLVHDLDEIAPPLLGEGRHRHADEFARGGRVEAEIGVADRLLDHRHHLLLPRLHGDRGAAPFGHARRSGGPTVPA